MAKKEIAPQSESALRHLTQGGLQTFAVKVMAVGLGFASQMLLSRLLGKADYGEFAFAVTTMQFLVIAAVLGADSVATRFVAKYHDSPAQMLTHIGWLNQRTLRISVAIAITGVLLLQFIYVLNPRLIWISTQLILVALPIQAFAIIRQGILRGLQKPVLSIIPEGILRPFFTIKFSLAFVFLIGTTSQQSSFTNQFESRHAVIVYILVTVVALIASQIFLNWFLPQKTEKTLSKASSAAEIRRWKSMALASMFSAFAMTIHSQSDVWMLGVLTKAETVGSYSVAARYAGFVIFGINAMNAALGPLVAKFAHDRIALQRLVTQSTNLSFVIATASGVWLICFPEWLLNLFGPGFDDATLSLKILVAANWFNVGCGSVGLLLSMTGNHQIFMKILMSSVFLNIFLNITLIPFFGMTGAAVATAASIVYWNLAALVAVKIRLKIRPTIGALI